MLLVRKIFLRLALTFCALALSVEFLGSQAQAGTLLGNRPQGLGTRQSTAALNSLNPTLGGRTFGTPVELAKVIKARDKAYKKILKKYNKDIKKAEKEAKKRKAKQEKLEKKEAKKREKLQKKLAKEQAKKDKQKARESEESSDSDGDGDADITSGSKKVEGSSEKEEGSFLSKLTSSYGKKFKGAGHNQNNTGKKLDTSKLGWLSRLFLRWFGTG